MLSSNGSSRKSQHSLRSANGPGFTVGKMSSLSANLDGRTLVKPNIPLLKKSN